MAIEVVFTLRSVFSGCVGTKGEGEKQKKLKVRVNN